MLKLIYDSVKQSFVQYSFATDFHGRARTLLHLNEKGFLE